jgi:hypothetical protein
MAQIASTSDERTINNVMRHGYRVLSEDEKAAMQAVKDKGLEFWRLLRTVAGQSPDSPTAASRELSVASTKIEEAVMWAVKHITK